MHRTTNRSSPYMLLLIAPVAWAALLLFTRFIAPEGILAFALFFLILSVALTSTLAPVAYFTGSRIFSSQRYRATARHALRQGGLLTLIVVLNLILLALHSWSIFTAIVIVVAALVLEILSLARKA
ncbi:hypothetical protein EPA93_35460 [Ktedonosporobacter rubrisoli]|uniref:Uncharacterized protein n=1 Tax=Ktedonosporobacter rubrisoli TaxID=2509675 RepID=A0A4P6JZE7_KTERU|nr:hypothetical protein [Ktedonosporobacter rubrisoli]QBD80985.1 hypothetical protein EPA93_35460 [Ktedonosporobacter rubrisoli]